MTDSSNDHPVYGLPVMDIGEFRDRGYLHEVNRRFFHPLGLALSVVRHPDGSRTLGDIIDNRDDPEGFRFAFVEDHYVQSIQDEIEKRRETRERALGYWVQPASSPGTKSPPAFRIQVTREVDWPLGNVQQGSAVYVDEAAAERYSPDNRLDKVAILVQAAREVVYSVLDMVEKSRAADPE